MVIDVNWEYIHDVALDEVGNITRLNSEIPISDANWGILSFYLPARQVAEVISAELYLNVTTAQASQTLDIGKLDYLLSKYDCWSHSWGDSRFIIEEESFGLYVESSDALQTVGNHWVNLGSLACVDIQCLMEKGGFFGIFLKGNTSDQASIASRAYSNSDARPKLRIKYR